MGVNLSTAPTIIKQGTFMDEVFSSMSNLSQIVSKLKQPYILILVGHPLVGKSFEINNILNDTNHVINVISRDDILLEVAGTKDYTEAWANVDQGKVNIKLKERINSLYLLALVELLCFLLADYPVLALVLRCHRAVGVGVECPNVFGWDRGVPRPNFSGRCFGQRADHDVLAAVLLGSLL